MINLLAIYVILTIFALNVFVECSYPITIEDDSIPLPPSMFGVSTVIYNDIIYTYGGLKYELTNGNDKIFSYRLDNSTGELTVKLENEGQGPVCGYCSIALFPGSKEILVLAEPYYKKTSPFYVNGSTWEANQTVLPHFYDIENKTWRVEEPKKKTGDNHTFYGRVQQTTVVDGSKGVYILGGLYRNISSAQTVSLNTTVNPYPIEYPNGTITSSDVYQNVTYFDPYVYSGTPNINKTMLPEDISENDSSTTTSTTSTTSWILTDGWYYDRHEKSYTAITLPNDEPLVGAIGYIDLDGRLAVVGGCNDSLFGNKDYIRFYNTTIVNLYSNTDANWTTKNSSLHTQRGYEFQMIAGSATEIDHERSLLYNFGGYYKYKNSSYYDKQFSILDLKNNIWIDGIPEENSEIQMPTSQVSLALVGNKYLVKLFGLKNDGNLVSEVSTADVLNLTFSTSFADEDYNKGIAKINWVTSILENNSTPSQNLLMKYLGLICVSAVVVSGIILFLILRRKQLPYLWYQVKKTLFWDRRKGEPIWTELSRLIFRIISLLVLAGFLLYNVHDVLTSTISTSTSSDHVDFVTIPDFRICLSGWNPPLEDPTCSYMGNNYNLTCKLKYLDSFYYVPHYASQMNTDSYMFCYMYAPQERVNVSKYNASVIITTQGYTYKHDEAIFFQLYRREENINRLVFNNQTIPGVSKSDVQQWSLNDTQSPLLVVTSPNSFTKIEYQETKYEQNKDDQKWNYVGVYPKFNKFTKLSMVYSQPIIPNTVGLNETEQYFFNSITIVPKDFTSTTVTEKRDSTILDIFGSIGGVIGLIVGLQVILFGTRPNRPWGLLHYWTWRQKSISDGLEKQFHLPEAQVPFVNPVNQRFEDVFRKNVDSELGLNTNESHSSTPLRNQLEDRLSRLEARNQLLEMIMRNYYIDDEVFIALSRSRNRSGNHNHTVDSKLNNQEEYDDEKPYYDAVPLRSDFNINESYPMPYPRK